MVGPGDILMDVRLLLRESRNYGNLLAHYDQLTGLPNRTLYRELLAKALGRSEERKGMVSVVFVSVDGFEDVSDALGRDVGDAVVRCVGDRLVGCGGPMDTVARLERDEFGMINERPRSRGPGAGACAAERARTWRVLPCAGRSPSGRSPVSGGSMWPSTCRPSSSRRMASFRTLREFKAIGVRISIDAFGTGYSSLAYLRRFPIDTLKIDISFIRDVTTNPDGAAIVVAIINLARSLKMRVIAEGVETHSQLDFLHGRACDEIQGFYCSRPLPAMELEKLREENPIHPERVIYAAKHCCRPERVSCNT